MAARSDWIRGRTFSHEPRPVSEFPAEAPVRVRTFGERFQPLDFTARVIGASSETHLRIRTDDGLVFAVPAADCDLLEAD
ncbi:MAG: hypothetical protein DI527_07545 [Chelatococcus sp.]|nr:MAG: hypothetical protein DI527_07545 [Chelatococcus sp.]